MLKDLLAGVRRCPQPEPTATATIRAALARVALNVSQYPPEIQALLTLSILESGAAESLPIPAQMPPATAAPAGARAVRPELAAAVDRAVSGGNGEEILREARKTLPP